MIFVETQYLIKTEERNTSDVLQRLVRLVFIHHLLLLTLCSFLSVRLVGL